MRLCFKISGIGQGVLRMICRLFCRRCCGSFDEMKVSEKDYLQVFKLSGNGNEQVILHEQEQPPYKKTHRLTLVGTPFFVGKIYVIDDGEHTTMLKASEY